MDERQLFFLAKFGQRNRMEELFKTGALYMQRLRAFQKIEHAQIGDRNEGLSRSLQPNKVSVNFNGEEIVGFAGAIQIVENTAYNPLIFCMYGFTSEQVRLGPGKYIDDQCLEFGDTVLLITDVVKFYEMIGSTFKKNSGRSINGRLIDYVDYDTYHGEMGPFRKYSEFRHQSEFRFVFEDRIEANTYLFEVGGLNDVAQLHPSHKLNELINIKSKAKH